LPSSEKAIEVLVEEWPLSVYRAALVTASQSWMVLLDLETTCLLFGEKVTDYIVEEWPSSIYRAMLVTASQSRTILSPDLEIICLLSGEKATKVT
jgi:hypothetical protein